MKRILVLILAVALLVGLFPTAVFAEKNVVDSCELTAQAQTDGVLPDTTGGTVKKISGGPCFACGSGVWTYMAEAKAGYKFVEWKSKLSWTCKGKPNSGEDIDRIRNKYGTPHSINLCGDGAFHANGNQMEIHHVGCGLQIGIDDVHYNIIAIFKCIPKPATLTVNHIGVTTYKSGKKVETKLNDEQITNKFIGDTVNSSEFEKDQTGYTYDPSRDEEKLLVAGANEIKVYYNNESITDDSATLTVNHIGVTTYKSGKKVETKLNDEQITNKFIGDTVNSSEFEKDQTGYTYDPSRNEEKTLATGANEIKVYYNNESITDDSATLTVNHIGVTTYKSGKKVETKLNDEQITNKFIGDTVNSSEFEKDQTGYTYDPSRNEEKTLATGANEIKVYYNNESITDDSATLTVKHIGITTYKSGKKVETTLNSESITNKFIGNVVKPSNFKKKQTGYTFDAKRNNKITLKSGVNELNIYYNNNLNIIDDSATLTVKHIGVTKYLSGKANTSITLFNETKEGKLENDKVKPSQLKNTYAGYTFDTSRDAEKSLVAGANTIEVYYLRTVDDRPTPPPYIPPTETIVEEKTPLTPAPVETIEEEEVPLATAPTKSPQTSDTTPIGILLFLAAASSAVLVAGKIKRLKESN